MGLSNKSLVRFSELLALFGLVLLVGVCQADADLKANETPRDPWGEHLSPKLRVNYLRQKTDTVKSFLGNYTHKDHFKLLQTDGNSLLIGARNIVYNLSLSDLTENEDQRISWPSGDRDRELCIVKGKSEDECQNYIRVLAQTNSNNLLVCGTNSFNPKCRTYMSQNDGEFKVHHEFSGKGYCPYDPKHNSSAIFSDGELYSGTVADFSGSDALIIRDTLRTDRLELKHLNAPDFVSSMEDEDHVYFFFRESAVEYINCGKAVYSRVARVCKNDRGGPHNFKNKWTSFLKTRLNCSLPGAMPFYFNEIQSTAAKMVDLEDGTGDKLVYGVFTTPDNAIAGSAVCSFRLSAIHNAFEGPFKGQSTPNSNWLPVEFGGSNPASPRPGSCAADSKSLSEASLNFIKRNSLMDRAVSHENAAPVFVRTRVAERFTVIAVDPQVRTPNDERYDVLFVGTTRGTVLKLLQAKDLFSNARKPVLVEEIQVFPYHVGVANVQVVRDQLVVLSEFEVKTVPLNRCAATQLQTCGACVALRDPYCAWDLGSNSCVDHRTSDSDTSSLLQDVFNGKHAGCSAVIKESYIAQNEISDEKIEKTEASPKSSASILEKEELDIIINVNDNDYNFDTASVKTAGNYSGETLTLLSILVAMFSLLIGFAGGFLTAKKCSKGYDSCGHHYLENQTKLNKQNDTVLTTESGYTTAPCNNSLLSSATATTSNGDVISKNNLSSNVPLKDDLTVEKNIINTQAIYNSPMHTATISRTGTINRTGTLCKKVYL